MIGDLEVVSAEFWNICDRIHAGNGTGWNYQIVQVAVGVYVQKQRGLGVMTDIWGRTLFHLLTISVRYPFFGHLLNDPQKPSKS